MCASRLHFIHWHKSFENSLLNVGSKTAVHHTRCGYASSFPSLSALKLQYTRHTPLDTPENPAGAAAYLDCAKTAVLTSSWSSGFIQLLQHIFLLTGKPPEILAPISFEP
jgi:hypothetical protein